MLESCTSPCVCCFGHVLQYWNYCQGKHLTSRRILIQFLVIQMRSRCFPPSAISIWTTAALCPTWARWWDTRGRSTWPTRPKPSALSCWRTSARSRWTKRARPTSSPRRWSRIAWRKWCRWTFTRRSRWAINTQQTPPGWRQASCQIHLSDTVLSLTGGRRARDQGVLRRPRPRGSDGAD